MNPNKITPSERLVIWRRRKGLSQRKAARHFRANLYSYRQWEAPNSSETPSVRLSNLKPFEVCYLRRLRAGKSLTGLASELGMTANWLCEIEHGRRPVDKLAKFWQKRTKRR